MPYTIHLAAVKKQMFWNVSRPQEPVPEVLAENWQGTPMQGLPVREIPMYTYPRVLYLHPNEPTITVLHRNDAHEVIHKEEIATEHLTKIVGCEAAQKAGCLKDCPACNELLEAALAEGWVLEPYIPAAPVKPNADLYKKKSGDEK